MAGVKISALPAVPSCALTDIFPEVQPASGGTTYKATFTQLLSLFQANMVTPQDGGIVYTDATSLQVLTPTATANQILQSGANSAPHWSTPTYPSASGTAGQIIVSDGTNNIYSTPTFPIIAGPAGNIIISNGTNKVNSTSLWPNTVGSAGTLLRSNGTSNAYSTSTFADTYAINTLLYNASANTVSGLAAANSSVLSSTSTGVPTWLGPLTDGQVIIGSTGATPVAATLTQGSGVTITNGAGTITIAATGSGGSVTSLTSGTGITLTPSTITTTGSIALTVPVAVTSGGTGLTSTTTNQLLYSSGTSVIAGLATGNNGALITSAGGVPSISSTLPSAVQTNITALGAQAQALNMNTHLINNVVDPASPQDAATKAYVDATAAGLSIQAACRLATTTALTVTYNNVSVPPSGVGATLTNATTQAALSIDGVATVVGNRILVKNQASALQNGIYTVTNIGSGATNWIMTRATDYDDPSEISPGDLVIITAGNTLSNSSWLETATVTSVGVDAINFSQFSASLPVTVPNGGTGLTTITAHDLIIGNGTSPPNLLAPSATSGVAVISQGASADPVYGTVVVAGGGTGLTSLTAHDLIIGNGTSNATLLAPSATSGVPLISQGSSSDPAYGTAVVAGGGTGNTTFTAYSVICAGTTATGAFQNVSGVGSSGQILTSNGASALPSWQPAGASGFTTVVQQIFTSNGTYTPTASMKYCIIEVVGGGGGGGGVADSVNSAAGAGGGGGGYSKGVFSAATIGASQTVNIGALGAGGASGNNAGSSGGTTSVGTLIQATGGTGGTGDANHATNAVNIGGVGGVGSLGSLNVKGQGGGNRIALVTDACAGFGGNSVYGGGAPSQITGAGVAAGNYGGGGSGAYSVGSSGAAAGGNGAAGVVYITEFI